MFPVRTTTERQTDIQTAVDIIKCGARSGSPQIYILLLMHSINHYNIQKEEKLSNKRCSIVHKRNLTISKNCTEIQQEIMVHQKDQ